MGQLGAGNSHFSVDSTFRNEVSDHRKGIVIVRADRKCPGCKNREKWWASGVR